MKKKFSSLLLAMCLAIPCLFSLAACNDDPPTECELNGHDFSVIVEELKPATCTEEGFAIAACSRCGVTEEVELPATGHDEITVPGTAPTCTKDGTTDSVVCDDCGEVIRPATTIPKGHTVGDVAYILTPPATSSYYTGYVEFYCGRGCKNSWGGKQLYTTAEHPDGQFPLPNLDDEAYSKVVDGEDTHYSIEIEGATVTFTVSNFEFGGYTYIPNTTYIYKYNGSTANLTVPETYDGKTVIGVNDEAFKGNTSLESVVLPSTMKEIKASAFEDCSNLTTINIPEGVTKIGDNAFKNCGKLTTISLPSTLTTIGKNAFANCSLLKDVSLPQSVQLIDEYAFENCAAITSLHVPVEATVNKFAFRNCTNLQEITLHRSTLGSSSKGILNGCNNLKKLTLTDPYFDLLNIFHNTQSYNSSHRLPESLKELVLIGYEERNYVEKCTYNEYDVLRFIEKVTLINCTEIREFAFHGFTALTDITVPDEMKFVDVRAFKDCSLLKTTLFNGGEYLGNPSNPYVVLFDYVEPATPCEFTVHADTKSIAVKNAFWEKFTAYNIPASVVCIGSAFECSPTAIVNYGGTVSDWFKVNALSVNCFKDGTLTFSDGKTRAEITDLVLEDGVELLYLDNLSCFNLNSITLPASVGYIQAFSFNHMENLKIYYNGEHEEWYALINNSHSQLLKNVTHVYFYDGNEYYEPTYIQYNGSIDNVKCFDKLEKLIIGKNVRINAAGTTFDALIGKCDLYYLGDADYWALYDNEKTIIESKFNVYCLQETEQTLEQFMTSPIKVWHYNQDGEPTAWVEVDDTAARKTYTYVTTTVEVSEAYWSMLQQAKQQGVIGNLLDATLLEMFNSSSTKEEFEQKLAEFSKLAGSDMSISFTNSVMTITKDGSVSMGYFEMDGKIYVKDDGVYEVYATVDGNTLTEGVSDEYVTTKHIWTCQ